MKKTRIFPITLVSLFLISPLQAAQELIALSTDGTSYEVDLTSGLLTQRAQESTTSFTLGGIVRKRNQLYYVSAPAGTAENALYNLNLETGELTHVDLDRAAGDDEVRALFFSGKKLYAIFYNGTAGTAGLYRLDKATGETTLVLDWSDLNYEFIGGAFARRGKNFYTIVKPESDSSVRKLFKFRFREESVEALDILGEDDAPILCERLKLVQKTQNFVCLAAPAVDQVDVCRLTPTGRASCQTTLENVLRVGGGHTLVTRDGKNFYAFVYEPGDNDNQRLIKLNARGVEKSRATIDSIMIGAHFDRDGISEQQTQTSEN